MIRRIIEFFRRWWQSLDDWDTDNWPFDEDDLR